MTLHHGDCLDVMAGMAPESVDAIVTDPPYGLEFMGKEWDRLGAVVEHPDDGEGPWGRTKRVRYGASARSMQVWHEAWAAAALRLAKPGAYLLAFGGTRTVHRLTCAIEDAGWVIRDTLCWVYASGFPKSKASLKPAWEPIVLAKAPGKLRPLNIDGCRIGTTVETWPKTQKVSRYDPGSPAKASASPTGPVPAGRWPANLILTDPIFDGDTEGVVGGGATSGGGLNHVLRRGATTGAGLGYGSSSPEDVTMVGYADEGTYSRFFLVPKADRADREPLLAGDLELRTRAETWIGCCRTCGSRSNNGHACGHEDIEWGSAKPRRNTHPTVKPVDLMRHLVRLVTPPDGTVLDPFAGSGSTLIAAEMEGRKWLGIEREAEYVAIAEARLQGVQRGMGLVA